MFFWSNKYVRIFINKNVKRNVLNDTQTRQCNIRGMNVIFGVVGVNLIYHDAKGEAGDH